MKHRLSALLDGDFDEHSMHTVLESLRKDASLRQDWRSYCLIGDCLRGERGGNPGFVDRVMAGLDDEPTVLASTPLKPRPAPERSLWQSLLPVAASVAGVAAVGVIAASLYSEHAADAVAPPTLAMQRLVAPSQVADAGREAARAAPQADVGLREYVFAHQGIGGGGPMPTAVQYVRAVSDTERSSAR